jgi:uncharacterized membrane protein affecting hemolysin expression
MLNAMELLLALGLVALLLAPLELTHRRTRHLVPPTLLDRYAERPRRPQWW